MAGVSIFKSDELRENIVNGVSSTRIMEDTCREIELRICKIQAGVEADFATFSRDDKIQFFAFTAGNGVIQCGKKIFVIDRQSLFIPDFDSDEIKFVAGDETLEFIHIIGPMNETDKRQMNNCQYVLPRFLGFDQTIPYTERFTQESGAKVKQHSVIAGRHLGRYTMGWVIGQGPDFVGQHTHPTLDQWYFMINGADFMYDAGEEHIAVKEGDISYTPSGTSHGSTCDQNGFINYIWFELNRAWDQ